LVDVATRNRQLVSRVRRSGKRTRVRPVTFAARWNLFLQPGGDTELLIRLAKSLAGHGYSNIDFHGKLPHPFSYRLVHIFNPDVELALQAAQLGCPYVLTPLYEDVNRYHGRAMGVVRLFQRYLGTADSAAFESALANLDRDGDLGTFPWDQRFVFDNAEAVLVSGESEGARIRRDFPNANRVEVVRFGFNRPVSTEAVSAQLFEDTFGVKDFVLCVGRLETRKNQLMLLYALRDLDVPLVFVNSTTVQSEYEQMCKGFSRSARTIFTDRISQEMLYSAYKAAKVHVLPSWYELPGLVTLEAAWFGCNVVASDWGTIREYLGNEAYYCDPIRPDTIRKRVVEALRDPPNHRARERAESLSWDAASRTTARIYRSILHEKERGKKKKGVQNRLALRAQSAKREALRRQLRGRAFAALSKDPATAQSLAYQLLEHFPQDRVAHYIQGVGNLSSKRYREAEAHLIRAIELAPVVDVSAYLYLALALLQQRKGEEAARALNLGLQRHPFLPEETTALIDEYLGLAHRMIGPRPMKGSIESR